MLCVADVTVVCRRQRTRCPCRQHLTRLVYRTRRHHIRACSRVFRLFCNICFLPLFVDWIGLWCCLVSSASVPSVLTVLYTANKNVCYILFFTFFMSHPVWRRQSGCPASLSNKISNNTTLRSLKQQIWLRTVLCMWRMMSTHGAMRNLRVACQKRQRRRPGIATTGARQIWPV